MRFDKDAFDSRQMPLGQVERSRRTSYDDAPEQLVKAQDVVLTEALSIREGEEHGKKHLLVDMERFILPTELSGGSGSGGGGA